MKQNFTLCLLIMVLSSCEPTIGFTSPQPEGRKNSLRFPRKIKGTYQDSSGINVLTVLQTKVIKTSTWNFKISPQDLDSTQAVIVGNKLVNLDNDHQIPFVKVGDSIMFSIINCDTLFSISKKQVLKRYKGHCFLSSNKGKNKWEVQKLSLQKGKLEMSSINQLKDLEKLKLITNTKSDTIYSFSLSTKEFKSFVHHGGFSKQDVYYKIK